MTACNLNGALRRQNLERLLQPKSVAIIGASADPGRIGGRPVRYLKEGGFKGPVFPVNPKRDEIQGLKSYPSIKALTEPVDVAVVAVPAATAVEVIRDCAEVGVGGCVLFSADFAEAGPDGVARQNELTRISNETALRILGPNCLGMFDSRSGSFLSFSTFFDRGVPKVGNTAIISHSGGFGALMFETVRGCGVDVGTWITTGNEADIELGECIEWAASQPHIDKILAYSEGVKDGASLRAGFEAASAAGKPVVFMKSGHSDRGMAAASTHTAALAGSDAMYQGLFDQFGVRRVYSAEEMADVAYMLEGRDMPGNRRVALFSISGAGGVQMSDSAQDADLDIPLMPSGAQAEIRDVAPFAAPANPVDFTAQALNDPGIIKGCLDAVARHTDFGSFVVYLALSGDDPRVGEEVFQTLAQFAARYRDRKFVLCSLVKSETAARYETAGFRVFGESARALKALGCALPGRPDAKGKVVLPAEITKERLRQAAASEACGKALLEEFGVRVPKGTVAASAAEAGEKAKGLPLPLVVKILSDEILHKSDVGGVRTGVTTPEDAAVAGQAVLSSVRRAMPGLTGEKLLLEEQVQSEAELIVGIEVDPVLGPMVMVGFGGVEAEIYKDVCFRMAPVDESEALVMLKSLRAAALFESFRGRGPLDTKAAARVVSKLSVFAAANADRLQSVDINPLLLDTVERGKGNGAVAADCVIVLKTEEQSATNEMVQDGEKSVA